MTNVEKWLISKGHKPNYIDFDNAHQFFDLMEEYAKSRVEERDQKTKYYLEEITLEKANDIVECVLNDINRSLDLDIDTQEVREEIIDKFYEEISE